MSDEKDVTAAYLDYAAATPMAPEVVEAMTPYLTERFFNPSAPYELARGVRDDVERARATLARAIGGRPAAVTLALGPTFRPTAWRRAAGLTTDLPVAARLAQLARP